MFKWEAISTKIDIQEGLNGTFEKIRQTLADLENTYGDLYSKLEIRIEPEAEYESYYTSFLLYGYREETAEEEMVRVEKEEKARLKRLAQLEKEKIQVEKRKKELEKQKKAVEKELAKLGAKP
jgi:hypothetical protein